MVGKSRQSVQMVRALAAAKPPRLCSCLGSSHFVLAATQLLDSFKHSWRATCMWIVVSCTGRQTQSLSARKRAAGHLAASLRAPHRPAMRHSLGRYCRLSQWFTSERTGALPWQRVWQFAPAGSCGASESLMSLTTPFSA